MVRKKPKDPILHTFDKYEVWWSDHISHNSWKTITDAKKDKPAIAFTEGYLLQKTKDAYTFFMTISEDEIGEEMIICTKNIKNIKKIGTRDFLVREFVYDNY